MKRPSRVWLAMLTALTVFSSSLIGCRNTYYAAYEKFGVYKRDLLKKKVVAASEEQQQASAEFKDALTRLKAITGFQGGELEKAYRQLEGDYEQAADRAAAVRKRIREVETVANDLFKEWEQEIEQISTANLKSASRNQLQETRGRYDDLHRALVRAEQSMEPVLVKFRDYVLYLKHNLNAQAIASLKGEAANIQADISKLIEEMNASITKADAFVKELQ